MLPRIVFCSIIKVARKSYETEIIPCAELPIIIKNTGANKNADKNTNVNAGTNVNRFYAAASNNPQNRHHSSAAKLHPIETLIDQLLLIQIKPFAVNFVSFMAPP